MHTLQRQRVHYGVGRLEIVPEPVRFARLRENLSSCRNLVFAVLLAQAEDGLTTFVAFSRGYVEDNPLQRPMTSASMGVAVGLKLIVMFAMMTLVLSRLPTRRARIALRVALAMSLVAPVLNTLTLLGR